MTVTSANVFGGTRKGSTRVSAPRFKGNETSPSSKLPVSESASLQSWPGDFPESSKLRRPTHIAS
ncbi:hypothetical protein HKD37_13G038599 [Glycine soja]